MKEKLNTFLPVAAPASRQNRQPSSRALSRRGTKQEILPFKK
jgi:hypothetical protein